MARFKSIFTVSLLTFLFLGCAENYTPKPKAYPRIDLPEKAYLTFSEECPFSFDYHNKSLITRVENENQTCWLNIDYPFLRCRIHMSYRSVENNLQQLLEDSRMLVYKHTIKASAINQKDIIDENRQLYAKIYEIDGDAASSVQFYATDSLNHFLRGALYFNAASNADSLRPAIDYIREDVENLVNSINWKNQ